VARRLDQTAAATHGVLIEGERVVANGSCWAAQLRRIPLLFLGRRRYLLVLTDRRLLLFARRGRHAPHPSDLLLGKRYEWFTLGRVRRARPLMQVVVTTGNGTRMLFEFQPHRREIGRALVTRLRRDEVPPGPGTDPAAGAGAGESVFWEPSTPSP
jgi:hypothetical protein